MLLDGEWFPSGIGFIHDSVGVQNAAMLSIRKSMTDPDKGPAVNAAIKTLGLAPLVSHLLVHTALYAKKLGLAAVSWRVLRKLDCLPSPVPHSR